MKKPIMNIIYIDIDQWSNFPNWEIYFPDGSYYCYGRFERELAYTDFYDAGGCDELIFEELSDEDVEELKKELWS